MIGPGDIAFTAESDPMGTAVALVYNLPDPTVDPSTLPVLILRRERRFPGLGRRGMLTVTATADDLADGVKVYDSTTFAFDFQQTRVERENTLQVNTTLQHARVNGPDERVLLRTIRRETTPSGVTTRAIIRVRDAGSLEPGTIYYYTAFVGPNRLYSRRSQSSSLAVGPHPMGLFATLPQVHQKFDTELPAPGEVGPDDRVKGQLQRFLDVVEAHAGMLRGLAAGLLDLHNPRRTDARLLDAIAQQIGWTLKDRLDEDAQRNEIARAPAFYATVGTTANIAALINRETNWDTQVRELARSVLFSFDGSRLETFPSGKTLYLDGSLSIAPGSPPTFQGRRVPAGSLNIADAAAIQRLKNRDINDTTAYTFDCGPADGQGGYNPGDNTWYNPQTIAIYLVPEDDSQTFPFQEEWDRVYAIVSEFLPIGVRAVFVLSPSVDTEEVYDATQEVIESDVSDEAIDLQGELNDDPAELGIDAIPGWLRFQTNNLAHRSANFVAIPVNTASRTWHTGIGIET